MKPRRIAAIVTGFGTIVAIVVVVNVIAQYEGQSSNYLFPIGLIVGPWLVPILLFSISRLGWQIACGSMLMLLYELMTAYAVLLEPQHSTAGLDYLAKPFVQLCLLLPIGAAVGWLLEKRATASASN